MVAVRDEFIKDRWGHGADVAVLAHDAGAFRTGLIASGRNAKCGLRPPRSDLSQPAGQLYCVTGD